MPEVLFGAIAEAVIGYWLHESGIADKVRRLFSREAYTLAFKKALKKAYEAFEAQHPNIAHSLFDEHFLEYGATPILARCLQRDNPPIPIELATAWASQFDPSAPQNLATKYLIEASDFLQQLQAELRSCLEFQHLFDSRALDNIVASSSQAAGTLVNLEQEIIRLREVTESQPSILFNVVLSKQPTVLIQTPSNVPPPVNDFVGREKEIDQLVQALRESAQGETAVSISGIRGLGGLGKTQLAYVVAQRIIPDFPDGQLLLNLQGTKDDWLRPEQALRTIITFLTSGANIPDVSDLEQLQSLYRNLLNGRRILILADNARDAKQVEPLLPPAGCAVLITSRQRFLLPGMRAFDLGTLSSPKAQKLLRDICPRIGSAAPRLAELCGFLPLALRISAELLENEKNIEVDSFLEELKINKLRALQNPDHPDDPDKSVWASFNLSYEALPMAAQIALCQLSIIPASFDQNTAVKVIDLSTQSNEPAHLTEKDLIRLLHRRNLLEWKSDSRRYDFHDLVRSFAQAHLEIKTEQATRLRLASYYSQIASSVDYTFIESSEPIRSRLGLFNPVMLPVKATSNESIVPPSEPQDVANHHTPRLSHVKQRLANYYFNFAMDHSNDWKVIEADWPQIQNAWDLISKESINMKLMLKAIQALYSFQDLRGLWSEAIIWGKQILTNLQETDDKSNECAVLNNLGVIYTNIGVMKTALDAFNQALLVSRAINNAQSESCALGNLGLVYAYSGRTDEAATSFEEHLSIARNIGDRHGEGMALNNLGSIHLNAGEFRRAAILYKDAIAIIREINSQREESTILANLGSLYLSEGNVHQALDFYQQALGMAQQAGDKRSQANIHNNLASAYASQQRHDLAIEHCGKALEIARVIGEQRGQVNILNNLAQVSANQDKGAYVIKWYEAALDISRGIGDRLSEGITLNNLGNAFASQGELQRALEAYQEALGIAREIGDQESESRILGNLGLAYVDIGDLDQATFICQQHLIKAQTIDDQRGVGTARRNWGHIYLKSGRLYKAIESYQQQLAVGRLIGDRRSEGNALNNLGNCYANLGQVPDAISDYYMTSLAIAREVGNLVDECVALGNLGNAYARLDKVPQSVDCYQQTLRLADEISNRRIKAIIAWNFGQVYDAIGQYQEAVKLMQTTIDYERTIGHPDVEKDLLILERIRNKIAEK